MEAKETAQHPARITTDFKCEERVETKETAEQPAHYTTDGILTLNTRNKSRPKKKLNIQQRIQQMEYVECEERVEAKETAEHPAHNTTCEERVGTKEI